MLRLVAYVKAYVEFIHYVSAPLLSVSAAAWVLGNPFNGTVFVALFLVVLRLACRLSTDPVRFGTPILATFGAMLVAFGWGYPHFLETDRWMTYAYAAPLGVLPCPTLSAVIGATLILGLLSAEWSLTLAAAGLAYGAVGVFVLGVQLDYALLAGALLLVGVLRGFASPLTSDHPASTSNTNAAPGGRVGRAGVRRISIGGSSDTLSVSMDRLRASGTE